MAPIFDGHAEMQRAAGLINPRVYHFRRQQHRAYGKAPTFSTNDSGTFKRAVDMTDDELAAIVAKAKLTVVK